MTRRQRERRARVFPRKPSLYEEVTDLFMKIFLLREICPRLILGDQRFFFRPYAPSHFPRSSSCKQEKDLSLL